MPALRSIVWAALTLSASLRCGGAPGGAPPLPAAGGPANAPAGKADALFREGFEDARLLERGWYDGSRFKISGTEPQAGKGCIEYHWAPGATTPESSQAARRLFEPGDRIYLSFYIRLSKGWGWSSRPYHPHLIQFI